MDIKWESQAHFIFRVGRHSAIHKWSEVERATTRMSSLRRCSINLSSLGRLRVALLCRSAQPHRPLPGKRPNSTKFHLPVLFAKIITDNKTNNVTYYTSRVLT